MRQHLIIRSDELKARSLGIKIIVSLKNLRPLNLPFLDNSMTKWKTAVSPLLMHWWYCSLELSHRFLHSPWPYCRWLWWWAHSSSGPTPHSVQHTSRLRCAAPVCSMPDMLHHLGAEIRIKRSVFLFFFKRSHTTGLWNVHNSPKLLSKGTRTYSKVSLHSVNMKLNHLYHSMQQSGKVCPPLSD